MNEIDSKLAILRQILIQHNLSGIRLRGSDWFSWALAGASNVVLLTAETGVAEVFVTARDAYVLTDAIEAERFLHEEVQPPYLLWSAAWQDPQARDAFVHDHSRGGVVASDKPRAAEHALPREAWLTRRSLLPAEIERYRQLGREAAAAMTEVLQQARPEWSEFKLAGKGAEALWSRGIHPALTLVGGDRRLQQYRHPVPSAERLGERAMLVFCARRHGLFANLTRFVYFRKPSEAEQKLKREVAQVEAAAWQASQPGQTLAAVYQTIVQAYSDVGHAGQQLKHHQGGPTAYLAREDIAGPNNLDIILKNSALAWNPSLPGTKIEDTILSSASKQREILTVDPNWPTFAWEQAQRPDYLVHI